MQIFDCVGVRSPNLHFVQGSIVLPSNRIVGGNDGFGPVLSLTSE